MKIFTYNNATGDVEINQYEVLLIKEFAALWEPDRNKCEQDPSGTLRLRAFREFKYIWLMLDWQSLYSDYAEGERHQECLKDAELTEKEWADPVFRAACRKYKELLDSSRFLRLIKSAQGTVDKISDYFDALDLFERKEDGTPIYKIKEIMNAMQDVAKTIEGLLTLEYMYKKEQEAESDVRGGAEIGFMDR